MEWSSTVPATEANTGQSYLRARTSSRSLISALPLALPVGRLAGKASPPHSSSRPLMEEKRGHRFPFESVKATWPNLLPIDDGILWSPDPAQAAPGVLNDLHLPPERLLDPLDKAAFLVCTVGPDQLESRKAALERFQELLAAYGILDIGFMHEHV